MAYGPYPILSLYSQQLSQASNVLCLASKGEQTPSDEGKKDQLHNKYSCSTRVLFTFQSNSNANACPDLTSVDENDYNGLYTLPYY